MLRAIVKLGLRMLVSACIAAGIAIGVLYGLERTIWQHERAAQAWSADTSGPWKLVSDELGALPSSADPEAFAGIEREVLWASAGTWFTGSPEECEDDEAWLRRKLAAAGVLSARVAIRALPRASLAQRIALLELRPRGFHVLALTPRDFAPAFPRARLEYAWKGDSAQRVASRAFPEPSSWWRRALLPFVPGLRVLLQRGEQEDVANGVLPRALWPWKRGGVSDETARYASIRAALSALRTRAQAVEAKCLLLRYPARFEVDDEALSGLLDELGLDTGGFESKRCARRMRDLCEELDFSAIDPTQSLRKAAQRGPRELFVGARLDARPTRAARRILIHSVARALRKLAR